MSPRDLLLSPAFPIGVDVGASGLRLVQLRRRGRALGVAAAARVEMPFADGAPLTSARIAALARGVIDRVNSGGFKGRACVISIDNRLVRVRSVRHPPMPDDELDRAVRLDAAGRLGFAESEQAEVGWLRAGSVRGTGDPREEVLVVGAPSEPIQSLVFALAAEGLRPLAVEPAFEACARAFTRKLRRAADQNTVRVIVDIGHATTGVTVTRGQTIAFFKQLEVGGRAMTAAAAQRLGIELTVADELRRQRAASAARGQQPGDPKVDRALFEAVRSIVGDLAHEVSLCLRYYGVTFRSARPDMCVIAGGEAHEPRLVETFAEALHLPVIAGRPLEGVQCDRTGGLPSDWTAMDAAWSVAVGLSLWDRRGGKRTGEVDESSATGHAAAPQPETPERRAA